METVSWSEINAWCTCRMKWYWNYDVRIVKRRESLAPSLGSCGHAGLAAFFQGEDWEQAVMDWADQEIGKRMPIFDEQIEEIWQIARDMLGVLARYFKAYPYDNFEILEVEKKFSFPLPGYKNLNLIGYWDLIVKDETGAVWLMEHKFPKAQFRDEEQVELDGQIGVYQYAARKLGYPVVGTIYNQILAKLPSIPAQNKNGSMSRQKIKTDWETYRECLLEAGLDPTEYYDMKDKLADQEFFKRFPIYRGDTEIRLFARDFERRVWDLKKKKGRHIYMSESMINCRGCSYKQLCLERIAGGDVKYLIEEEFMAKPKREEEFEDEQEVATE